MVSHQWQDVLRACYFDAVFQQMPPGKSAYINSHRAQAENGRDKHLISQGRNTLLSQLLARAAAFQQILDGFHVAMGHVALPGLLSLQTMNHDSLSRFLSRFRAIGIPKLISRHFGRISGGIRQEVSFGHDYPAKMAGFLAVLALNSEKTLP
ncbi:MAG: hypothetical protein NTV14_09865 [Coprothermobacterota bacterium]|nr:hypothetical protein [Coprothermobacterota bacterium]